MYPAKAKANAKANIKANANNFLVCNLFITL